LVHVLNKQINKTKEEKDHEKIMKQMRSTTAPSTHQFAEMANETHGLLQKSSINH